MDRSLLRQQRQRAALAKRTHSGPVQRVGVTTDVPGPQFPPVVKAAPSQATLGNVIPEPVKPLKWHNTDNVVRSTGRNDNTYTDWRWGS